MLKYLNLAKTLIARSNAQQTEIVVIEKGLDPRFEEWELEGPADYVPPAPEPVQITEISFAQLIGGLVTEQWITKEEGQAWLRGTLPAPVVSSIASLPEAQQIFAEARAVRPSVVLLNDPLVQQLAALQSKTAELPSFFNTYGAL